LGLYPLLYRTFGRLVALPLAFSSTVNKLVHANTPGASLAHKKVEFYRVVEQTLPSFLKLVGYGVGL